MKKLLFFLAFFTLSIWSHQVQGQWWKFFENNYDKVADSVEYQALKDLYTSTTETPWKNDRNWLQGDDAWEMSRWHGISVLFRDVYNVILINNNLKGEIPASLANLREMRQLFLSNNELEGDVPASLVQAPNLWFIKLNDNQLTGFPDFSAHPFVHYMIVDVSRNNLDFGDLEPNFSAPGRPKFLVFHYNNQDKIGTPQNYSFRENQPFELQLITGGQYNHYQWQKKDDKNKWVDIPGATRYFYAKEAMTEGEVGVYRCQVKNDWVTGLTLYSHEYTVELEEYYEITFHIDTRDMLPGLSYEILADGLSGTYPFGGVEEFVIANPIDTTSVLLNVVSDSVQVGVGYSFQIDPNEGNISDLKLVKGMEHLDLNQQLFRLQGSQLTLLPLEQNSMEWPSFNLLLQDGLRMTRNGDGMYDILQVAGLEEIQSYSLEVQNLNNEVVFATTDKTILWDGTNMNSNTAVPEGLYHYTLSADGSTVKGQFFVE